MASGYRMTIQAGVALVLPMTYKVAGVPTAVSDIKSRIRSGSTPDAALVLDLASRVTQVSPGELVLTIGQDDTEALPRNTELWWDMFATAAGQRVQLVAASPVTVYEHVSSFA